MKLAVCSAPSFLFDYSHTEACAGDGAPIPHPLTSIGQECRVAKQPNTTLKNIWKGKRAN